MESPRKSRTRSVQPFFTTKPTGQGTGLGLSLSYDIIKSHGGELKVNAIEGESSDLVHSTARLISWRSRGTREVGRVTSKRRLVTGFAIARLINWKLMVNSVISTTKILLW